MTTLRHLALGCCVLSTLAGMLRLFWPENGFKPVINAVLALYIITAGVQIARGVDWGGILAELRALPADGGAGETDYSAYQQDVALLASAEAVREVLRTAGIDAAVSLEDGVCVVTPVDVRDKDAITSLLAVNAGALPWRFAGDAS